MPGSRKAVCNLCGGPHVRRECPGIADGGALSPAEAEALAQLVGGEGGVGTLAGTLPREALASLHAAGLVRFVVPICAADRIAVPPLTGFVMNRVGHDYLERLLYDCFVSRTFLEPS